MTRIVSSAVTVLAMIGVGCGAERVVRTSPPPTDGPPSTSADAPTTSAEQPSAGRVEGVVVDVGQNFEVSYRLWWVVDVTDGSTVDGASRLLVDVADDELGCGDDHRPISSFQISVGDTVSFAPAGSQPGVPPELFMGGTGVSSAVAVAARQFRIECPAGVDDVAATIAEQRARWQAAGIDSYEFNLSWMQFNDLAGDYRITVIGGAPHRIVRSDGIELDPDRLDGRLPATIADVFDELQDNVTADAFTASYDPQHGYPVEVHIDEVTESVDDELEIRITDFTIGAAAPPAAGWTPEVGERVRGDADRLAPRAGERFVELAARRSERQHRHRRLVPPGGGRGTGRADVRG